MKDNSGLVQDGSVVVVLMLLVVGEMDGLENYIPEVDWVASMDMSCVEIKPLLATWVGQDSALSDEETRKNPESEKHS